MNIKSAACIVVLFIFVCPFNAFAQPVIGACCSPTGSCTIHEQFDCLEGPEFTFMGGGTSCDPNPCRQPTTVPTMNEWGMIIFMALAGLGAGYCLRRQKRVVY
ncbi:MAG TPA: IPTL-CTERM sorting domain-containing protein [Thermodesulfovibrionales bacterium]|nr:IPTL-CTERM sorting domain-containing protein [Thermodesulfovibrionales bacterium]